MSSSDAASSSGASVGSGSDSDSSGSSAGSTAGSGGSGGSGGAQQSGTRASLLFEPFRAIGVVADDNRAVTHRLGEHTFVTASIGKAWQSFRCDKLSLALVSPPLPAHIRAIACARDITYTAAGSSIFVWRRVQLIGELRGHSAPVTHLLCLGPVLLSVDDSGVLLVWGARTGSSGGSGRKSKGKALARTAVYRGDLVVVKRLETGLRGAAAVAQVVHPATYLNKVLIATRDGQLQLWNFNSGRRIHASPAFPPSSTRITALAQSPVVDVVAVGREDGSIVVHNIRADKTIAVLADNAPGSGQARGRAHAITSLSFCTDRFHSPPLLASGSSTGAVVVWDLEERAVLARVPAAHDGAVATLEFLAGEVTFVTTGTDNSLKQWVVDSLDGSPRLLRSRTGHKQPPTRIRYRSTDTAAAVDGAAAEAHEILSAGSDRQLRVFHAVIDRQNRELSQGDVAKRARKFNVSVDSLRLPPIVDFSMSDRRIGQWCNVVSAHAGLPLAYMWSWENKRVGKHVLQLPAPAAASASGAAAATQHVTATCISACGNYALVGSSTGTIALFNMQSGLPRGTIPRRTGVPGAGGAVARAVSKPAPHSNPIAQPDAFRATRAPRTALAHSMALAVPHLFKPSATKTQKAKGGDAGAGGAGAGAGTGAGTGADAPVTVLREAHSGQVTGLAVDVMNKVVVSTGVDRLMRVWDMDTRKLLWQIDVGCGVAQLVLHRDAGLVALACDDWSVHVYDLAARRRVRRFAGHSNRITDVAFSADARWLVTAAMDCCVRVWDLPTARCVDWLKFQHAVTSVALSPTTEFLATCHVDLVGIYLWANRVYYGAVSGDTVEPRAPCALDMPAPVSTTTAAGSSDGSATTTTASNGGKRRRGDGEAASDANTMHKRQRTRSTGASSDSDGEVETTLVQPLSRGAATLSSVPRSRWSVLPVLDVIQQRNKPKEAPKAPAAAPFFLPTVAGFNPKFIAPDAATATGGADAAASSTAPTATTAAADGGEAKTPAPATDANADDGGAWDGAWDSDEADGGGATADDGGEAAAVTLEAGVLAGGSRILRTGALQLPRSRLAQLLVKAAGAAGAAGAASAGTDAAWESVAEHLAQLTASQVDVQVRQLCSGPEDAAEGVPLLAAACDFFLWQVASRRRFEVAQAHLNLFLKVHAEVLGDAAHAPVFAARLATLQTAQRQSWRALQALLQHTTCLVQYLADVQGS